MRQAGDLPREVDARRFVAFLYAQGIDAAAEQDGSRWIVWIHDEDKLTSAREQLVEFAQNPTAERYRTAEKEASERRRLETVRRQEVQKNLVTMGGQWQSGGSLRHRRAPLVFALIVLSVLVAGFTQLKGGADNFAYQKLAFAEPEIVAVNDVPMFAETSAWHSIRRGEVWRLVTPILLHFSVTHIVFNVMWLYSFGGQLEERRGSWFFALFVLATAVASNVPQAMSSGPAFGGLSGVGYALFGYVWMAVLYGKPGRYRLDPTTVTLGVAWLILCMLRDIPAFEPLVGMLIPNRVANVAHVAGLLAGMAWGVWER